MTQYKFNLLRKAYQIYDYINIFNKNKYIAFVIRESADENMYKEWKEALKIQGIQVKLINTRVIASVLKKDFASGFAGNQIFILYTNTSALSDFFACLKKYTNVLIPLYYIVDGICLSAKEAETLIHFPVLNKVLAYEQTLIMPSVEIISWLENRNEQ